MLTWGIVLVFNLNVHVSEYELKKGEIFTPFMGVIFSSITVFVLGILIAFPLEFRFYAMLCCFWGLINLIDGGSSAGFLMYLLGVTFAFRAGFFKKYRSIKIAMLIFFPILALVSQIRININEAVFSALNILCLTLIFALIYLLFLPDIRKLRKQTIVNTNIIYIPSEQFSERDLRCLKKVQDGEKYESIAKDEDIALSTLKNKMKAIYTNLNVLDRTSFLSNYAGYTILLKPSSKNPLSEELNQATDDKTE
jgi:DNA-binding CsgD family transcriptional regulator